MANYTIINDGIFLKIIGNDSKEKQLYKNHLSFTKLSDKIVLYYLNETYYDFVEGSVVGYESLSSLNEFLSLVLNQSNDSIDMIDEIQTTGYYNGKEAYIFIINGRRQGFNNTTTPHDLKEFDSANNFFTQLTGSESLEIVSSSADDNSAGTGIRSVKITYIDTSNNIAQSAAVSLNGITPVPLGFKANEILWMESASSGDSRLAQGDIVIRIVSGVELEQISQNSSKSKTGKFMVPAGYTGYLCKWNASAINNDQDLFIVAQKDSLTNSLTTSYHYIDNSYTPINTPSPDINLGKNIIPSLSRIKLSTISSGTGATIRASASFMVAIVKV